MRGDSAERLELLEYPVVAVDAAGNVFCLRVQLDRCRL